MSEEITAITQAPVLDEALDWFAQRAHRPLEETLAAWVARDRSRHGWRMEATGYAWGRLDGGRAPLAAGERFTIEEFARLYTERMTGWLDHQHGTIAIQSAWANFMASDGASIDY